MSCVGDQDSRYAAKGAMPRRPWLGASFQEVTPQLADGLGLDAPTGVLIANVDRNGPANGAGLKAGDLIVSLDGTDVDDLGTLNYRLVTKPLGTTTKRSGSTPSSRSARSACESVSRISRRHAAAQLRMRSAHSRA